MASTARTTDEPISTTSVILKCHPAVHNYAALFAWFAVLTFVAIVNTSVIYANFQIKVLRKNFNFVPATSMYVANVLYTSVLTLTGVVRAVKVACEYTEAADAMKYIEIFATSSLVINILNLSMLCFYQLKAINVNNTIIKNTRQHMKKRIAYMTLTLWIVSLSVPVAPVIYPSTTYIGDSFCIACVIITMLFYALTYVTIDKRQQKIRRSSIKSETKPFVRIRRLILSNSVILALVWLPLPTLRIVREYMGGRVEIIKLFVYLSVAYTIVQPVLQVLYSKELKEFFQFCLQCRRRINVERTASNSLDNTITTARSLRNLSIHVNGEEQTSKDQTSQTCTTLHHGDTSR